MRPGGSPPKASSYPADRRTKVKLDNVVGRVVLVASVWPQESVDLSVVEYRWQLSSEHRKWHPLGIGQLELCVSEAMTEWDARLGSLCLLSRDSL